MLFLAYMTLAEVGGALEVSKTSSCYMWGNRPREAKELAQHHTVN